MDIDYYRGLVLCLFFEYLCLAGLKRDETRQAALHIYAYIDCLKTLKCFISYIAISNKKIVIVFIKKKKIVIGAPSLMPLHVLN